jgi:hypothetical protein
MVLLLVFALFIPLLYMPQEADGAVITVAAIIAGVALAVQIWIYLDGRCDYCGNGSEDDHTTICTNCHDGIYVCPGYSHPHVGQCGRCYQSIWACNTVGGPTSAQRWAGHISQSCDYCPDEYVPCIEGDNHGDGICNDDDGSSSGTNSSG